MSRRHTSHLVPHGLSRSLGLALVLLLALTAMLPTAAVAQGGKVDPRDVRVLWQLLEYRDANGKMEQVPPGIGVTFLPFANVIKGQAACSSYEAGYSQSRQSIFIDPPQIKSVVCDPAGQAVDDAFFGALGNAGPLSLDGSILTLYDAIEEPLLKFTRAVIPLDPTIATWKLARIGSADGSIGPVIQGVKPEIQFLRGGRVVGSTGCGSFLGSYKTNDSNIRITDVDYRLADCTEALRQQAEDIIATLADITDFDVLPAGLTLEDASGATRLAFVPAIELGNRTWTPVAILDKQGQPLELSERLDTSAVRFGGGSRAGGTADGRSYCRGFEGRVIVSGLALSMSGVKPADGVCPRTARKNVVPPQVIEDTFLDTLRHTSSYALRGDELELMDADGSPVMRLVEQAELVGPTWVVAWMDGNPRSTKVVRRKPKGTVPITATFDEIKIVKGDTGAGANGYLATYSTPGAAQIDIDPPSTDGRACTGSKARKPLCKQQTAYLALLQSADGIIVRENDLRLLKGTRPIVSFVPEQPDTEG